MKTNIKQKQPTLQKLIDELQSGGGGGTVDAYTKAESDAKFLSKTDAASTYIKDDGSYITVNGIRLYISSTEPTGTIPDGSIGVGW